MISHLSCTLDLANLAAISTTPFLVYTSSNGLSMFRSALVKIWLINPLAVLLVQTFLVYRVYMVSKNWMVAVFLECIVLLSLAGAL